MKFRIAEVSIPTDQTMNAAWWPQDGEWEGDNGAEAIERWARETDEAGQGVYLAIPVDAIEEVDIQVEREFVVHRRVAATTG